MSRSQNKKADPFGGSPFMRRYRMFLMWVTPTVVALTALYWLSPWSNFSMPRSYAWGLLILALVAGGVRYWGWRNMKRSQRR